MSQFPEAPINSIDDLLDKAEVTFTSLSTSGEKTTYHEKYACFIDENDVAYYATLVDTEVTVEVFRKCLKQVPDSDIYPKLPENATVASLPITMNEDLYLKLPGLPLWKDYEKGPGKGELAKLLLNEVEIFELLRQHPHPNIVPYHGCKVSRGLITGILMGRYPYTLQQRLENGPCGLDKACIINDIESAVQHLHSLSDSHATISTPATSCLTRIIEPSL